MRQISRMFFGVIAAILLQVGMAGWAVAQDAQPATGQGGGEGYVGGDQGAAGRGDRSGTAATRAELSAYGRLPTIRRFL